MSGAPNAPRLPTADEEASWTAISAAIDELVAAFQRRDPDGMASAKERMLAIDIDWDAYLNAIRVPRDAGEWGPALEAILRRIPDGWGRWIGIGAGWYPIVVTLDRKLAVLSPGYRVLRVKEKFGGLRYYWRPGDADQSQDRAGDCNRLVEAAEVLAARTCEQCGGLAALRERQGWLRTLCDICAGSLGYSPSGADDG